MNAEILGWIWILCGTAFGTWTMLKHAYAGYKRAEHLRELGELRERDDALREEQERMLRR